jgi:hypothetical protein
MDDPLLGEIIDASSSRKAPPPPPPPRAIQPRVSASRPVNTGHSPVTRSTPLQGYDTWSPSGREWTDDLRRYVGLGWSLTKQIAALPFRLWWYLFKLQFTLRYWKYVFLFVLVVALFKGIFG